jgi:hypothetical protein
MMYDVSTTHEQHRTRDNARLYKSSAQDSETNVQARCSSGSESEEIKGSEDSGDKDGDACYAERGGGYRG